jgi:UDP-glucose 4-epimerase
MAILVTGGAGYIGSHTVLALLRAGQDVIVVDSLVNSSAESLERVASLADRPAPLYVSDVRDRTNLRKVFTEHPISAVIHFAGLKSVAESVSEPARYYENNIDSTLSLIEIMSEFGVRDLVFSSSATVYGQNATPPLAEDAPLAPVNPYGHTKAMIEQILRDLAAAGGGWRIALLRYFNPVGADPSGRIGEDPQGIPNNLLPFVAQVAVGRREEVLVFGDDYDTPDGTGVRDYIHVADLADGHLAALNRLPPPDSVEAINLGTGQGSSVLDMLAAFEAACGHPIPRRVVDRRPGDVGACWADVSKAKTTLGWQAVRTLEDACVDSWRWQEANPRGYAAS